jgi:hypothetical protein
MAVTWNPVDNGGLTLSNGDLTVNNAAAGMVRANISKSAGKWYWEIHVDAHVDNDFDVGIATDAAGLTTELGQDAYGWAINDANGYKYNNASGSAYGLTFHAVHDVIGIALDLDGNTLTFYINNASQGEAFASLTGTYFPAVSLNATTGTTTLTVNFGATTFVYTPPAGFSGFDTPPSSFKPQIMIF